MREPDVSYFFVSLFCALISINQYYHIELLADIYLPRQGAAMVNTVAVQREASGFERIYGYCVSSRSAKIC